MSTNIIVWGKKCFPKGAGEEDFMWWETEQKGYEEQAPGSKKSLAQKSWNMKTRKERKLGGGNSRNKFPGGGDFPSRPTGGRVNKNKITLTEAHETGDQHARDGRNSHISIKKPQKKERRKRGRGKNWKKLRTPKGQNRRGRKKKQVSPNVLWRWRR